MYLSNLNGQYREHKRIQTLEMYIEIIEISLEVQFLIDTEWFI